MFITEKVPEKYLEPLKDCYYDLESFKLIMPELITLPKEKIDLTLIGTIKEKIKESLIKYNTLQIEFEYDFVKKEYPNAISWNLTFGDGKVLITLPDNE